MTLRIGNLACAFVLAALAACSGNDAAPATETVVAGELVLSAAGEGELRSAKPTPLSVPGRNWAARQLEWMLPEGSVVAKGELLAKFRADEGKQQLDQALIDLQRNALARLAKDSPDRAESLLPGVAQAQVHAATRRLTVRWNPARTRLSDLARAVGDAATAAVVGGIARGCGTT